MIEQVCPAMDHLLASELCTESFAGVGSVVYIGLISDLEEPMEATDELYSAPVFKTGAGLYKIDCKEEANNIVGESQGANKGFKQTLSFTVDEVTKRSSKLARALNNRRAFYIVPDGDDYQILYDPVRKIKPESGAINANTGSAAADARETTYAMSVGPVKYPNNYVTIPDILTLLYKESEGIL